MDTKVYICITIIIITVCKVHQMVELPQVDCGNWCQSTVLLHWFCAVL